MKTNYRGNKLFTLIARSYNAAKAIIFADSMILNNIGRPSQKDRVNLHFWDSSIEIGENCKYNLGDNLSPIVVEYMLEKEGLSLNSNRKGKKHLYAIGSIIMMGYQNATIWGSGILQMPSKVRRFFLRLRKLDIRAVRGPLTRKVLLESGQKCPEVYGDPGMLLPLLYKPNIEKKNQFLIIPHFSKQEYYEGKVMSINNNGPYQGVVGSMVSDDYKALVDQICASDFVISGSLHGIIISEAYGVPAVFLRDRDAYKDFKYLDYYQSTKRADFKYATTIEEALEMGPMPLPSNIKELQEGLIKSFPYDLWN